MGDRGVEPNEVLCCSHQLGSEVDQLVRQAQMGLATRGTMTGADFRRHLVDERPSSLTVHYPGDFAEFLQTSEDVCVLLPISSSASTYALTVSGVIRVPGSESVFLRRSREVVQPSPIAFGGFRVADVGMVRPGADLIVQNVASGAGGKP